MDPAGQQRGAVTERSPDRPRLAALDGLRAAAFLMVFGYHAEVPGFAGGFLGVDVFFVLSGFLVTRLLLDNPAFDGGAATAFVARRLRRLMPLLVVVVLVTTLMVLLFGTDGQMFRQRGEAIATLLSVANVWAILESQSYFAQFVARSPLTPTWSLSIEVQFYLLWSLVALVAARTARHVRNLGIAAGVLALGSVAAMAVGAFEIDPSSTYFSTIARVHEPLLGSLLAIALATRPPSRHLRWLAPLGMAVVALSFAMLRNDEPAYYVGGSIVVSVGVALVIAGALLASETATTRVLGLGVAAALGRISYSAYLWHWPVIITLSERRTGMEGPPLWVVWLGVTVALSAASYRWIELAVARVRQPAWRSLGTTCAAVGVAIGCVLLMSAGARPDPLDAAAPIISPAVPPERSTMSALAVVGDSVAQSLLPGFTDDAAEHGYLVADGAFPGCPVAPVAPARPDGSPAVANDERCRRQADRAREELVESWVPDVVVWASTLESSHLIGADGAVLEPGTPGWRSELARSLRAAIGRDKPGGSRLIVLMPPLTETDGRPSRGRLAYREALEQVAEVSDDVTLVDLGLLRCSAGPGCFEGAPDRPDGIHFSPAAAALVVQDLASAGLLPREEG